MKPATIVAIAAIPALGLGIMAITVASFFLVPRSGGAASLDGGEVWASTLDEAKARSAESGQPVLAVFSASWCPPCKSMKANVYPRAEVVAELDSSWEPVYIDIDRDKQLASQYRIRGVPSYVLMDADGQEFDRFSGGYPDANSWLDRLNAKR
jgi:thiol-disulfide isomerase/thioredoxin